MEAVQKEHNPGQENFVVFNQSLVEGGMTRNKRVSSEQFRKQYIHDKHAVADTVEVEQHGGESEGREAGAPTRRAPEGPGMCRNCTVPRSHSL